jgi:uncharacterized protein YPO0396
LVIMFEEYDWKPKHATIGLFEAFEITWHSLTKKLIDLLNEYGLKNKIITYVKNKGFNSNIITNAFIYIVKC